MAETRTYVEFEQRRVLCKKCGSVKRERLEFLAANNSFTRRLALFKKNKKTPPNDALLAEYIANPLA